MQNNGYPFLWDSLLGREVLLYGVGDGADKIFDICEKYSVNVVGVFASDDFSSGKTFRGFTVMKRSEALRLYPDAVILLCFAVFRDDMMKNIIELSNVRELYAPDVAVMGGGLVTLESLRERSGDIKKFYENLADDTSKNVLEKLLQYKFSGNIKPLTECESDRASDLKELFNIKNGVYVDLGAYRGDTIEEYISLFGEPKEVYAFEPAPVNFRKLNDSFGGRENYHLIEAAAYKEDGEISFSDKSGRGAKIGGKRTVQCLKVDSVISQPVDYIKIDVEGAELDALEGMKDTIKRSMPYISLSAYHRMWDIIDLGLYIAENYENYEIFLRHHPYIPAWDVMLYLRDKNVSKQM